jgi:hypothetical protein
MSGMFYIIARVYVMKFEVCQECCNEAQVSLHKHGIAQITSDIPETSLHKHGTIT